jgi:hypothetical protein
MEMHLFLKHPTTHSLIMATQPKPVILKIKVPVKDETSVSPKSGSSGSSSAPQPRTPAPVNGSSDRPRRSLRVVGRYSPEVVEKRKRKR